MRLRPWLKGGILLTLAFLLGVAAGVFGLGAYLARWGGGPGGAAQVERFVLRRLDRELGLTPAQREQVEAALREAGQEFGRLRQEVGPRFREIRGRARERIRGTLDPAQRERFEALVAQREQRMERRWGWPPGRP